MGRQFKALFVSEENGKFIREIKQLDTSQLHQHELLIRVKYSSLNYKDALSASGNKGVTRKYPHVPGIDAAGVVVESNSSSFRSGDEVIVTGFDLGMNTWGGFGEYIGVPADWVIALPAGLSLKDAMSYGTAGLTAGLSVHRLQASGVRPEDGPVAVSGASGGVGSMAIGILSRLGYEVLAISGKQDDAFLITILGAAKSINREEFINSYNSKPMYSPEFSGGIDTVGGEILSGILKATRYGGTVTACGMVSSGELNTTIFPFILRGVTLAGIDSVLAPMHLRKEVWQKLASEWRPLNLAQLVREITIEELPLQIDDMLNGNSKGRFIVGFKEE